MGAIISPLFAGPPTYTLAHDQLIKKPEQLFFFFLDANLSSKNKEIKLLIAMIAYAIN